MKRWQTNCTHLDDGLLDAADSDGLACQQEPGVLWVEVTRTEGPGRLEEEEGLDELWRLWLSAEDCVMLVLPAGGEGVGSEASWLWG